MAESKTISRDPQLKKSMDYQALKREGIQYLQQLSGKIWTDFNKHDPGVTLLENLCYALTDIAYRTNIAIEKLLFYNSDYQQISKDNCLYGPEEIFPCGVITPNDYRILILDQIPEINNVWLAPVTEPVLGITGLYNITLQMANEVPEELYKEVKEKVRHLYAANRNLCEDLCDIIILQPITISISATIDISTYALPEEVLAALFYRVDNYFNPKVKFYSFEELLEKGVPVEKIFESPSFERGFILSHELLPKNNEYYLSSLTELISSVQGVKGVENLVVKKNGNSIYGSTIKIDQMQFVRLSIDFKATNITKNGMPYDYTPSVAQHLYEVKLDKYRGLQRGKTEWKFDKTVKPFDFSKITEYSSVQNMLPSVYGVGNLGLPERAPRERKIKALQLKGYILLFDQMMANHLMQLKNINRLFSINHDIDKTYYSQLPTHFPDIKELLKDPSPEALEALMLKFDNFLDRKNRIFDHLLARFGENFTGVAQGSVKNISAQYKNEEALRELLILKADVLRNYVTLSRQRATSFNYYKDAIDQNNVPVFKHKVSYAMHMVDHRQRSLVKHIKEDKKVSAQPPGKANITTQLYGDDGQQKYRHVEARDNKVRFLIKGKRNMEDLFLKGGTHANYYIRQQSEQQFLVLFDPYKTQIPVKIAETQSADAAKKIVAKLVHYFEKIGRLSEGFHVIEHALLRPYGVIEYNFHVLDNQNNIILESLRSLSREEQEVIIEQALIAGLDHLNYQRIHVADDQYGIMLNDRQGNPLIRLNEVLYSDHQVHNKIEELVNYFQQLDTNSTLCQTKIVLKVVKEEKRRQDKSFYNHKMSIILPDWVSRFVNADFKTMFKKSIRENIPAHIEVNYIWLNIDQMEQFEYYQKQWLEYRRKSSIEWKTLDKLSIKVIDFLDRQ